VIRAIVTGAARNIGAAIADRLARDGGAVAYVDILDEVVQTAAAARTGGATAIARVADISDENAVDVLVPALAEQLGGLNVLVNCAGVGGSADPVADLAAADFRATLEVNLVGAFLMARAFARRVNGIGGDGGAGGGDGGGAIVNIGSLFGQQGVANSAAYCASKGAIATLTHTLAHELGPAGIRVNTIAPGFIDTEMHFDELRERARRSDGSVEQELADELRAVALGRLGTGEDIAGVVAWLASSDAGYVTGQTIAVNGGVLMS
jgi:NAD(P)-dependent dehydrogenase (short-subunit alcohol dehydrogenase family)